MSKTKRQNHRLIVLTAMAVVLVWWTPTINAQEDPVTVSIEVGDNPMPGAMVTATATVEITDGSTVESYSWTQTGGVEAALTGTDLRQGDARPVRSEILAGYAALLRR